MIRVLAAAARSSRTATAKDCSITINPRESGDLKIKIRNNVRQ